MVEWEDLKKVLSKNIRYCEGNAIYCENDAKAQELMSTINRALREGVILR